VATLKRLSRLIKERENMSRQFLSHCDCPLCLYTLPQYDTAKSLRTLDLKSRRHYGSLMFQQLRVVVRVAIIPLKYPSDKILALTRASTIMRDYMGYSNDAEIDNTMLNVEYRDLARYRYHSVRLLKAHERHQDFFAVALSASASSSSIRFAMASSSSAITSRKMACCAEIF
jgi:hypothetical protein